MKAIIPLYDLKYFDQVLKACQRYGGNTAVILNVDDGPGKKDDDAWTTAIRKLKTTNAELFGYVELFDWDHNRARASIDINTDTARWVGKYGISRFFYDDFRKGMGYALVSAPSSIANPGTDLQSSCGITMSFEDVGYIKSKSSQIKVQAVLSMGDSDWRSTLALAKSRRVAYFYATDLKDTNGQWNAYDRLPPYFDVLMLAIATP